MFLGQNPPQHSSKGQAKAAAWKRSGLSVVSPEQASATAEPGQVEGNPQPCSTRPVEAGSSPKRGATPSLRDVSGTFGRMVTSVARQSSLSPKPVQDARSDWLADVNNMAQPTLHISKPDLISGRYTVSTSNQYFGNTGYRYASLSTAVLYRWEQASADRRHQTGGKQAAAGGAAPSLRDVSGENPPQHSRTRQVGVGLRRPQIAGQVT
ncbi:hypothetical protein NQZ68_009902 [Dissostichus eleginoides]|nr:hypothetical protein NQZ68_009902 [Dissostichus eleginoides]